MLSCAKAEQFSFSLHVNAMKFKPRWSDLCLQIVLCFHLLFCVNPPDCVILSPLPSSSHVFSFIFFYLGRSAWIYCVTSFGVPSPLSRNHFLTLYFLLSSIQYSRQMIILCCRYKHGYRGHYLAQLLHYYGARLSH